MAALRHLCLSVESNSSRSNNNKMKGELFISVQRRIIQANNCHLRARSLGAPAKRLPPVHRENCGAASASMSSVYRAASEASVHVARIAHRRRKNEQRAQNNAWEQSDNSLIDLYSPCFVRVLNCRRVHVEIAPPPTIEKRVGKSCKLCINRDSPHRPQIEPPLSLLFQLQSQTIPLGNQLGRLSDDNAPLLFFLTRAQVCATILSPSVAC